MTYPLMRTKIRFRSSQGHHLMGILSDPTAEQDNALVVLCHGRSSSKESRTYLRLEQGLNNLDIATFRFDFFGHGESDGAFEDITVSEFVDDILSAIAYVRTNGYQRVALAGSSMGGLAILIAAARSPDLLAIALKSPVSDFEEVELLRLGEQGLRRWKKQGYAGYRTVGRISYAFYRDLEQNNGYEAARMIRIPTLIVHGDADRDVPVTQSQKTARLIQYCKLEVIKGVDHHYQRKKDFDRMAELMVNFIAETLLRAIHR